MPPKIKNEIETRFTADDRFSRSVGRMSKRMQRLNRIAGRVKRALMATGRAAMFMGRKAAQVAKVGLLAMAGAATALFVSVNRLAGGMDELAKTTRAIDFDIEKFQEFRFVAEQTGVSGEKFGTIVKKFSATVGEFKGGYGTMFTALKRLDPQLSRQLKKTSDTAEAFEIYLGAIRMAPTALKKTALASAAFGKRMGIDMINMANLSANELEKLRSQMRENGIVTEKQAKKAEIYNDTMNRLKLTAKGLAVDALTPLMPLFTRGAEAMRRWIVENRAMIKQRVHEAFTKIISFGKKAFSFLRTNVPPLIKQLRQIGSDGFAWIKENKKEIKDFFGIIKWAGRVLIDVTGFLWKHKEAALAVLVTYKALSVTMRAMEWASMVTGANTVGGAFKGLMTKGLAYAKLIGKGGAIAAAGYAGWKIGGMLVDEMNRSLDSLLTRANNVSSRIGLMVSKMKDTELESALKTERAKQERQSGFWTTAKAMFTGRLGEQKDALKASKQAQIDILKEQSRRLKSGNAAVNEFNQQGFLAGRQSGGVGEKPALDPMKNREISPVQTLMQPQTSTMEFSEAEVASANRSQAPQAHSTRTETVTREVVELIIKDKDGRAEVSGGHDFNGLTLQHTGGM